MLISEVEARNNILFPLESAPKPKNWLGKKLPSLSMALRRKAELWRTLKKVVGHKGRRKKKGFCPPEKRGSDGQRSRSRGARPI